MDIFYSVYVYELYNKFRVSILLWIIIRNIIFLILFIILLGIYKIIFFLLGKLFGYLINYCLIDVMCFFVVKKKLVENIVFSFRKLLF